MSRWQETKKGTFFQVDLQATKYVYCHHFPFTVLVYVMLWWKKNRSVISLNCCRLKLTRKEKVWPPHTRILLNDNRSHNSTCITWRKDVEFVWGENGLGWVWADWVNLGRVWEEPAHNSIISRIISTRRDGHSVKGAFAREWSRWWLCTDRQTEGHCVRDYRRHQ